eukprot:RCo048488
MCDTGWGGVAVQAFVVTLVDIEQASAAGKPLGSPVNEEPSEGEAAKPRASASSSSSSSGEKKTARWEVAHGPSGEVPKESTHVPSLKVLVDPLATIGCLERFVARARGTGSGE